MQYIELRSHEIKSFINPMAALRVEVFKEWPYIYDGNFEYECQYLKRYWQAKNSFVGLLFDPQGEDLSSTKLSLKHPEQKNSVLVGMTTAIDLAEEEEAFKKAFQNQDRPIDEAVYFGESLLLPKYRGQGWGKKFMQSRIDFAKNLPNKKTVSFCSVIRPSQHDLKPLEYQPLDGFWERQGFKKTEGMTVALSWKDRDQSAETRKELQFWLKNL